MLQVFTSTWDLLIMLVSGIVSSKKLTLSVLVGVGETTVLLWCSVPYQSHVPLMSHPLVPSKEKPIILASLWGPLHLSTSCWHHLELCLYGQWKESSLLLNQRSGSTFPILRAALATTPPVISSFPWIL